MNPKIQHLKIVLMGTAGEFKQMEETQMSPEMFERYAADPTNDAMVRAAHSIPSDRYYSVSTWPPERAGRITLTGDRTVKSVKISKSDQ